jgi:hypothetical protein
LRSSGGFARFELSFRFGASAAGARSLRWSVVAIPLLHAVAVTAGASSVHLLHNGTSRRMPVRELVRGLAGSFRATLFWTILGRRRAVQRLERLTHTAPVPATAPESERVAYLNANLWFGLRAGGSVAHVAGVVNGLREVGFDVDYFGPGEAPLLGDSVHVHRIPAPTPLALRHEANVQRLQAAAVERLSREGRPPYALLYQRNSNAVSLPSGSWHIRTVSIPSGIRRFS